MAQLLLRFGVACAIAALAESHNRIRSSPQAAPAVSSAYQAHLIRETESLRPKTHTYAGYSGPWLENYFFQSFLADWQLTQRPLRRIYVPVAWTDCLHQGVLQEDLQRILDGLYTNVSYFSVSQVDLAFGHPDLRLEVPANVDFLLFSAGGPVPGNAPKPSLLKVVPVPLLKEELKPIGMMKNIAVSSQSSLTHPLRQAIYNAHHKNFLFLKPRDDWKIVLESSQFALAPRGFGATSFRMYEALQLGTVPVYVWETERWLPYQELVDWDALAVIVKGSDIESLQQRLQAANISLMQEAIGAYKHMFTYNFTVQYILKHIASQNTGGELAL